MTPYAAKVNVENFRHLSPMADRRSAVVAPLVTDRLDIPLMDLVKRIEGGDSIEVAINAVMPVVETQILDYKEDLAPPLAVEGYNLSGMWLGKRAIIKGIQSKGVERVSIFGKQASVALSGPDELVAVHLAPGVEDWIASTSKFETEATARQYQQLFEKAQGDFLAENSQTIAQLAGTASENTIIAANMQALGLEQNIVRGRLMARTMSVWAYNEGSMIQYQDSGVEATQWFATLDDATGEWDAALHGTVWPVGGTLVQAGETFSFEAEKADGSSTTRTITNKLPVQHPPLHPNCRCALLPVLA